MPNDSGLSQILQYHGCPMMDDTEYSQSASGEFFTSVTGIGMAASWLTCVSPASGPKLPGTCADCVVSNRASLESGIPL